MKTKKYPTYAGKMLTKEEWQQWYTKKHPIKASLIGYLAKLIIWSVMTLGVIILLSTAFIAVSLLIYLLRWSIGVWL
jgi:hypothetical protein